MERVLLEVPITGKTCFKPLIGRMDSIKSSQWKGFPVKGCYSAERTSSKEIEIESPVSPTKFSRSSDSSCVVNESNGASFIWQSSVNRCILDAYEDQYGGIVINPDRLPRGASAFTNALQESLSYWNLLGKKGVWLKLPLDRSELVPVAVKRDLPIGILGSLLVCAILYVGVCLVITGMVPYQQLGGDSPLAEAFTAKGLKLVSILISIGAVAGLTTTLLVGLYVQSRLYLGLGRDGLLPKIFANVHPTRHTPIHSQVWVGTVAGILSGLFNVQELSHILSVGTLTGYSVVSACVITLRWKDNATNRASLRCLSSWLEGVISLIIVACSGFAAGLCYRFGASYIYLSVAVVIAILAAASLHFRQAYADPPGFSCPGVPIIPVVSIFFNIFLFAQLHEEAWYRFVILSLISVVIYAIYGQYNAVPVSSEHLVYHGVPAEAA